jgi:hypothetical protein
MQTTVNILAALIAAHQFYRNRTLRSSNSVITSVNRFRCILAEHMSSYVFPSAILLQNNIANSNRGETYDCHSKRISSSCAISRRFDETFGRSVPGGRTRAGPRSHDPRLG